MSNKLVDDLLVAAALCGMQSPGQPSCHRTQLFFVLWSQRGKINATSDFQNAIQNATKEGGFFENDPSLGRLGGRYRLSPSGEIAIAKIRLPSLLPPAPIGTCRFSFNGNVAGQDFKVLSLDGDITIFVDGIKRIGKDAAILLGTLIGEKIYREKDSAPRNILDYGVRNNWTPQWLGPR